MSTQRAIGVDVGGTEILAGLLDGEGTVAARIERPTPTAAPDDLLLGARGARRAIALTLATGVGGPPAGEVAVVAAALGAEAGPVGAAPIAFESLDAGG
jgi:glucokinase